MLISSGALFRRYYLLYTVTNTSADVPFLCWGGLLDQKEWNFDLLPFIDNKIGDTGVIALAASLPMCAILHCLTLGGNYMLFYSVGTKLILSIGNTVSVSTQHDILLKLGHNTSLTLLNFPRTKDNQQSIVIF